MEIGFFTYIFSISLGIVSYLACLWIGGTVSTTSQYLYGGNNSLTGFASISGTVVSASMIFTGTTALYLIYGSVVFPAIIVPAGLGLWCVYRRANERLIDDVGEPSGDFSFARRRADAIFDFDRRGYVIEVTVTVYFLFLLIAEMSVLYHAVNVMFGGGFWPVSTVVVVAVSSLAYVYAGGFRGVLYTDVGQVLIMVAAIGILAYEHLEVNGMSIEAVEFIRTDGLDVGSFCAGCAVLSFCWFSASPEIWMRVVSLKTRKSMRTSILLAIPIIICLFALPVLLISAGEVLGETHYSHVDAYLVWKKLITESSSLVALATMGLIVSAVFTTLDTFIISIGQFSHNIACHHGESGAGEFVRRNLRPIMVLIVILCCGISTKISTSWYALVGVYGVCMTVPLFFFVYVFPRVERTKDVIAGWWYLAPLPVTAVLAYYLTDFDQTHMRVKWEIMPLSLFAAYALVALVCRHISIKRRGKNG